MSIPLVLRDGERVDDLMRGKMRIIQNPSLFRFGTDAVLLADFADPKKGERICDLGTGTGILPLLLAAREPDLSIDAVEIQPVLYSMAMRNIALNDLRNIVRAHLLDLKDAPVTLGERRYDCVVCNPPYFAANAAIGNVRDEMRIARHEVMCTLADVMAASARLLRHNGRLCVIHPASRALQMPDEMRAHGLEPKAVRAVHASADHAAKLLLWEARKGGRNGLTWLPPLLLRERDGSETAELRRIYGEVDAQ